MSPMSYQLLHPASIPKSIKTLEDASEIADYITTTKTTRLVWEVSEGADPLVDLLFHLLKLLDASPSNRTISYEILTGLGPRYARQYKGGS